MAGENFQSAGACQAPLIQLIAKIRSGSSLFCDNWNSTALSRRVVLRLVEFGPKRRRSTWDYIADPDTFLAVLAEIERVVTPLSARLDSVPLYVSSS
jgi:hypothetical protein